MENGSTAALRPRGERKSTPERRQEIVRAAAKTFGSKGYQRGSLIAIAEQVGMTHAGVLHHFGSKEQLALEAYDYAISRTTERLARSQDGLLGPVAAGLRVEAARRSRPNRDTGRRDPGQLGRVTP